MKITVSAPGKLMLMGEHSVVYGYHCLVTAVSQRIKAGVELTGDDEFILEAPDVGISGYRKKMADIGVGEIPRGARFIEIAVRNFRKKKRFKGGLKVATVSEFSSEFGFGSSSASTVCIVKALSILTKMNLSNKEIFDISYQTVLDIQGRGSGFDIAAAIWGGTLYFGGQGKISEPLDIINIPLIVGYSGVKADSSTLLKDVAGKRDKEPEKLDRLFDAVEKLVEEGKTRIIEKDWERLGRLFNFNQEYLRNLGISTDKLEKMITAGLAAGAYGAKLSGAGGGDCMIALCPPEKRVEVEKAISDAGGTVIRVETGAEGVRIETTDDQSEQFIVVDENDNVIGFKSRYECHHNPNIIHRAVGIAIFNDKGELLLEKRSLTKDTDPGTYSISAAGHLTKGDTYESATSRELFEELGIQTELEEAAKFDYISDIEHEKDVIYRGIHNGPFKLNNEEIDSVIFVSKAELPRKILSKEIILSQYAYQVLKSIKFI